MERNTTTWTHVQVYLDSLTKRDMKRLLINLATTHSDCNSCDDPAEVLKVLRAQVKAMLKTYLDGGPI